MSLTQNQNESDQSEPMYSIEYSKEVGRYLVASRDIEAREIIIQEDSFLSAPADAYCTIEPVYPRCLGCSIEMIDAESKNRCTQCLWPICCDNCEKVPNHVENECQLFTKRKVPYPPPYSKAMIYKSILVLRAILLKHKKPKAWSQLMEMESHIDIRKNKPNCNHTDERILANLKTYLTEEEIDENEICRLSGIIDVNAHVLPQKLIRNGKNESSGVCHIFPKTSLLSHSCSPNAAWSTCPNSDAKLITRSSVKIKKGEEITVCYDVSEIFYGTLRRLIPMEISGLFICKCARCLDPTEFGTNLSTLICQKCKEGFLKPLNPVDSFGAWPCSNPACDHVLSDEDVLDIMEELELSSGFPKPNVLFSIKPESIHYLESFIKKYSGTILHPNHYILLEIKLRLIKQNSRRLKELSRGQIEDFIKSCNEFIKIADALTPGYSEYKAMLQFHLSQGVQELLFNRKLEHELDPDLIKTLRDIKEEAIAYFRDNLGYDKYIEELQVYLNENEDEYCDSD